MRSGTTEPSRRGPAPYPAKGRGFRGMENTNQLPFIPENKIAPITLDKLGRVIRTNVAWGVFGALCAFSVFGLIGGVLLAIIL